MYKNKTNKLQENCHSFFTFSVGIFLLKSIWLCFKMHFRRTVWKKVFSACFPLRSAIRFAIRSAICFASVFYIVFPEQFSRLFFFPALSVLQSAAAPPNAILPVSPDIIFLFVIARFFAQEFEKKIFVFFIAPHIVFYVVFTTIRAHSDKNILYFIYNGLSLHEIPHKNHFLLCFFKA